MAVIVKFSDGSDWVKANWMFRQLLNDVVRYVRITDEAEMELQQSLAFGLLDLGSLVAPLKAVLVAALIAGAQKTLNGEIAGWKEGHPDDRDGQRMYLQAIAELLTGCRHEAGEDQGAGGRKDPGEDPDRE